MKLIQKLLQSLLAYTISAMGVAMCVTAAIGVSPYNSMNLSVAHGVGIRIGTATIIFNSLFLIIYIVLTKFKHWHKYTLQVLAVMFFGTMVNLFVYHVFNGLSDMVYIEKLMLLVVGTIIGGFAVGFNLHINLITFPIEDICVVLSEKTKLKFAYFRYSADTVFVVVAIALALINSTGLPVREGTLVSMVLFTYAVNLSKEWFTKRSYVRPLES